MEVKTVRRATLEDTPHILAVIGSRDVQSAAKKFGRVSVEWLIENSVLAISALDEKDQIVGFGAFLDSPPPVSSSAVFSPSSWHRFWTSVTKKGSAGAYDQANTLWMVYFAADNLFELDVAEHLLRCLFTTVPRVEAILAAVPKDAPSFTPVNECFSKLEIGVDIPDGADAVELERLQQCSSVLKELDVYACPRQAFVPDMIIRTAEVEDHDDLVPIFEEQSELLTELYGEFFLAELIQSQSPTHRALVAEINGRAQGLLCLTSELDTRILQKCFNLDAFDNFRRADASDDADAQQDTTEPSASDIKKQQDDSALQQVFQLLLAEGENTVSKTFLREILVAFLEERPAEQDNSEAMRFADFLQVPTEIRKIPESDDGEADQDESSEPKFTHISVGLSINDFHGVMHDFSNAVQDATLAQVVTFVRKVVDPNHDPETADQSEPSDDDSQASSTAGELTVDVGSDDEQDSSDNVFCVTLFCLDRAFESRSADFLDAAFQVFPDREYCVLTLPHTAEESFLLRSFIAIPPKPFNTFPHCLYVHHRDAVRARLSVRLGRIEDTKLVKSLVSGTQSGSSIMGSWHQSLEDLAAFQSMSSDSRDGDPASSIQQLPRLEPFVIECDEQVVGVVVAFLGPDVDQLRSVFALDNYVNFHCDVAPDCADIIEFVVNPLFLRQTRFVLQEVMRQSGRACLFYRVGQGRVFQAPLLREFVQVAPRHVPGLPKPVPDPPSLVPAHGWDAHAVLVPRPPTPPPPPDFQTVFQHPQSPFALHAISRSFLANPKTVINSRILVVGASDTGLSLIKSLIMLPHLEFTNITLLSTAGLPAGFAKQSAAFMPWSLEFGQDTLDKFQFSSRVSVVADTMVDINWQDKHVILADDSTLPYDFLVLTCGLQALPFNTIRRSRIETFSVSEHSDYESDDEDQEERVVEREVVEFESGELSGVFTLNHSSDVETVVDNVVAQHNKTDNTAGGPIVVYGHNLAALSAISGLMELGVPGCCVVWAQPQSSSYGAWCNQDVDVHEKLDEICNRHHIRRVFNMRLKAMESSPELPLLTGIRFWLVDEPKGANEIRHSVPQLRPQDEEMFNLEDCGSDEYRLTCCALICCDTPDIDQYVFAAVNQNPMVYDGRLVVDHDFKTKDASIFAAGSMAKFSRQYGLSVNMEKCNSITVGEKLAQTVLAILDEHIEDTLPDQEQPKEKKKTLPAAPEFNAPKAVYCRLPGGMHYFYANTPELNPKTNNKTLGTEKSDSFVKLEFSQSGVLRAFTYVGSESIQMENLARLVGLHQSYMNELFQRYNNGEITDFISFFEEEWATALFHGNFSDFRETLSEAVQSNDDMQQIIEKLQTWYQENKMITSEHFYELFSELPQSTKQFIQEQTLEFLHIHDAHLPGYRVPMQSP